MKQIFLSLLFLLLSGLSSHAYAIDVPNFPSCVNPSGELIVKYDSGKHGVVGDAREYSGSDAVYQIDEDRVLQCLCTDDGKGIQTNWWKTSSLNQDEIDQLVKQGWNFVPDGSVWGLGQGVYLAQNIEYSCSSGNTNGGGTTSTTSSSSSGGSVSGTSTTSNSIGGAVLGLAATGGNTSLFGILSFGVATLLFGLALRKFVKN